MDEEATQRLAELEDRVDSLSHGQARLERGAVDENGQAWTLADLLNIGLSRRQAMGALASIAGGATLATALTQAVAADASTSDGDGDVGQPGNRVDVFADGVDATSVTTESLVIGGTLYEQDGNSPFTVSSSTSATYTISGSYDEVLIIPESTNFYHDQLQVNGITSSDYRILDNSDSRTTGQSEWDLGNFSNRSRLISIRRISRNDVAGLSVTWAHDSTGQTVAGQCANTNITSLDSFTVIDSGGSSRDFRARVYGRVMNV
jgi:hypothetical protein